MKKWQYKTPGIPDELFIRGDFPMTKEEVRAVVVSKLRLKKDSVVYDIGAGTGSISIEMAAQSTNIKVFAVERKETGVNLITKNKKKFTLDNIEVVQGSAPKIIESLPEPDRVIIGGSGGHLKSILNLLDNKLKEKGRLVITAVTLNTLNLALDCLENLNYNLDICNIAVTRTREVANYHMFNALNPIYIISADRR